MFVHDNRGTKLKFNVRFAIIIIIDLHFTAVAALYVWNLNFYKNILSTETYIITYIKYLGRLLGGRINII